ncbi:MAG TPA: hypothetical protein VJ739_09105 [Gemmataceae bacterium]|nr:hypothetical protein [Gemmataceae bacterium]
MPVVAEPLMGSPEYRVLHTALNELSRVTAESAPPEDELGPHSAAAAASVVRVISHLPGMLFDVWHTARRLQESEGLLDHQATAEVLRVMFERFAAMLGCIESFVAAHQSAGFSVEGAEQLATVRAALDALRAEVRKSWPWFDRARPPVDRAMVEGSRKAIREGQYRKVEDILGETEGPGTSPG